MFPFPSRTQVNALREERSRTVMTDSQAKGERVWAPLEVLGLAEGAPPQKLPLAGGETYSMNAAGDFVAAVPFASFTVPAA